MPSESHQSILVKTINEYFEKGYKLISLNSNLTDNYRPDAVMENEDEMVIIEVIITSDRTRKVEDLQKLFHKTLRIDKRMHIYDLTSGQRIRMNEEMINAVDRAVKIGSAMNRSDFIRHAVSEKLERLSILKDLK